MPRRSPPAAKLLIVAFMMMVAVIAPTNVTFAAGFFQDDFESGTLNAWTSTNAFTVQQAIEHNGSWAGRATATSGPAFASRTIAGQTDVYLRVFVHVVSHSGTNQLLRMASSTGSGSLVSLNLTNSNQLQVKNNVLAETRSTGVTLATGTFVDLQLHLHIGGANGAVELWVNGAPAPGLGGAWNFGTTPTDGVVLGAQAAGNPAMDVVYDDVEASTTFIGGGGGPTIPPTPTGFGATPFHDHVDLSWNASSGATSYTVFRDSAVLATTASTSFIDRTVSPQTTYQYSVDAFNDAGHSAPTAPFSVTTPSAPTGGGTVVRAAGDIACDPADTSFNGGNGTSTKCRQKHTAQLLAGADRVFAIGDAQYNCGGLSAFNAAYHPTWGVHRSITHPILSDEDYDTSGTGCGAAGADGYFSYFNTQLVAQPGNTAEDPTKGYYSFDVGSWHVIALNSECIQISGGCGEGGAQNNWLEADLATSTAKCTMALLHAPLFTSKSPSGTVDGSVRPLVQDLYDAGAEMFLSGDKHFYERFRPQTPTGTLDNANGIVQWIVGVGGKSRNGLSTFRRPNSATATAATFGVLELTLNDGSYAWDFIVEGSSGYSDTGSASCH